MSASMDIRDAIATALEAGLTLSCPILKKKDAGAEKDLMSLIETTTAELGICAFVCPPLPRSFMQGNPFVFFDGAVVRVRVVEYPLLNMLGFDGYELVDDIALCLHWHELGGLLAHPMQLAERPVELVEDAEKRIFDVVFEMQYQINKVTTEEL